MCPAYLLEISQAGFVDTLLHCGHGGIFDIRAVGSCSGDTMSSTCWTRSCRSSTVTIAVTVCFSSYVLCGLIFLTHYVCWLSALALLFGRKEEHPACKNWVMRCWCGYLSAVRCRLFAYGPADAAAISKPHHLLPHLNPYWLYLSGTCLPRLFWKRGS